MRPTQPATKHLVLVGGGHAHALVVRAIGMAPLPGVDVTVIAKEVEAPYSGMLPGFVAGHYSHAECHIDLVRLGAWAGVRLVHGEVTGIDRQARRLLIRDRAPLGYDLVSFDVGITPSLDDIAGAARHAIAVKPVTSFAPRWLALEAQALKPDGPRRLAVVGSGAAGFELVLAARHRLRARAAGCGLVADDFRFILIGGARLLPSHNAAARQHAHAALARAGVEFIAGDPAVAVEAGGVVLASGRRIAADAVMVTTKAAPPAFLAATDMPRDEAGYLAVRPTLQLLDDDDVFAVGDCASVLDHPREKAGVFAVRQGPPLLENLRRRAAGQAAEPFVPQRDFLTLLSTGGQHAIAARGPLALAGDWVWRWKDRIDREFMTRFSDLPRRAGMGVGDDDAMRCMGCAAKLGPAPLARALARVDALGRTDAPAAARDDAAVIDEGGEELRLETVDLFPAFWPEPYLLGEIAARHAIADILAMGGRPLQAQAIVTLPEAGAGRSEEDLFQLLAGARAVLDTEGVALVGGHTGTGEALSIGFHIGGRVARERLLLKGGLRPGDRLVLTRPIGTGLALAALNRDRGAAATMVPMLADMRASQTRAAQILLAHAATAATDVTGFGLAGHLLEMLAASGAAALLDQAALPLYPMVLQLARDGLASTLLPANLVLADRIASVGQHTAAELALLFDPQTAGPLLAGVPADKALACRDALRSAGYEQAAVIGEVIPHGDAVGRPLRLFGAMA